MKKYVVISDTQHPFHDQRALDAVCNFIADWQPDVLLHVGDEVDSPEPSKWNRGMAGEYAGTLQKGIDSAVQGLAQLRDALGPDKPIHLSRSNHSARLETYVRKYAPALAPLRSLFLENLMAHEALGITFHRSLYEFHPGWVLAHGDEGSLSRVPGGTALGLARQLGKSVICGHTHRLGIQHETRGMLGTTKTLWGMEVGNLMDMRKASYLKTGAANWVQGFATLQVDGKDVHPVLHQVIRGKTLAYGKAYAA